MNRRVETAGLSHALEDGDSRRVRDTWL